MNGCTKNARAGAAAARKTIRSYAKGFMKIKINDIYDGKYLKINEEMKIETMKEFKYLG